MNEVVTYSNNVVKLTTEIKIIQDNVCQGMIEIGKRLIEIKKELGHGQWLPYLENELGYSNQTGNRLMKVATEFGDLNSSISRNIQSSKVIELLSLPMEHRETFINNSLKVEDITVKQLREEITKYKHDNDLMTEKQKKAYEDKKRAEDEVKRLEAELRTFKIRNQLK